MKAKIFGRFPLKMLRKSYTVKPCDKALGHALNNFNLFPGTSVPMGTGIESDRLFLKLDY